MYIRLFANANNSDEALQILDRAIYSIKNDIETQEIVKLEPYWKIEGVYIVETNIVLRERIKEEQLKHFLNEIADKWIFYGGHVNEALTSETTQGCNYIKKGINMINIFY